METKKKIINTGSRLEEYINRTGKKVKCYQKIGVENCEHIYIPFEYSRFDCEEEDFMSYWEYIFEHNED
jgi:hypothetical protein